MNMKDKHLILIVEDDKDILESIKVLLEWRGYDVITLRNGKNAVATAEKRSPALIIMDIMMPPPDGFEVCKRLKENEQTKKIPIILLSARTQNTDIDTGFGLGADRYLTKPFQNEELLDAISGLIA